MKTQKSLSAAVVSPTALGFWLLAGAILLIPAAIAQDEELKPIPAAGKPPSEIEQLEAAKRDHPAKPGRSVSVDELLDIVSKQPGGKERIETAKAHKPRKAVLASDKPPAWIEQLEKGKKEHPAKPGWQLSVDELLDLVSKQPGGKEKIEKAKAHARGKGLGGGMAWLPRLNPFRADSAEAFSTRLILLERNNQWNLPNGRAYFHGSIQLPGGYWSLNDYVNHAPLPTVLASAGANGGFDLPQTGYYLINLQTAQPSTMSVWLHGPPWVKQEPDISGTEHVILLYLSAGQHWVYWSVASGKDVYVTQITVDLWIP